jgi:hypothetical protein
MDSAPDTAKDAQKDAPIDAVDSPCNPLKQNCADPSLNCQFVKFSNGEAAACEPIDDGPVAQLGDACVRSDIGHDNCAIGGHCMPNGSFYDYICRAFCAQDSDCPTGQRCAATTATQPYLGNCFATCTPFSDECGKLDCANSLTNNDHMTLFDGCRVVGKGAAGDACKAQWDCGKDMNCKGSNGKYFCHLMCDDAHPCPGGGKCNVRPDLPNNGGNCN